MRAFGYLRISYDPFETSLSTERQKEAIARVAVAKGFTVTDWFEDRDLSAFQRNTKRPGWDEMAGRLKETRAIFVWQLDRAWRRMAPAMTLLELLDDMGIRLVSVGEDLDSSNPHQRTSIEQFFVMAANESRRIASRTSSAHRYNATVRKRLTHPRRMFGFDYDPATKTMTVNEDEAPAIREMAAWYIAGHGDSGIARALNDGRLMGARVPPAKAEWWGPASVRKLLTSPRLAGYLTYRGEFVEEGPVLPAILDEETWHRLQAVRKERQRADRRPSRGPGQLLYGLARCGGCGGPMSAHEVERARSQGLRTRYKYYRCTRASHAHLCPAPAVVPIGWLDDFATSWFFKRLPDAEALEAERELDQEDPTTEARIEMARIERSIDRLLEAYAGDDAITRNAFDAKLEQYRDELLMWTGKADAVARRSHLQVALPGVRELWPQMDVRMRREVLTAAILRIDVTKRPRWSPPSDAFVEVHRR